MLSSGSCGIASLAVSHAAQVSLSIAVVQQVPHKVVPEIISQELMKAQTRKRFSLRMMVNM